MIIEVQIGLDSKLLSVVHAVLHMVGAQTQAQNQLLTDLKQQMGVMMAKIDDILSETARQTTIEDSMEVLLQSIKTGLVQQGLDAGKVDQAFAAIQANNDRAAAAIVANTPVGPAPAPPNVP